MYNLRSVLPYLHVFNAVASNRSFTRAAAELCVTQSSVSYQIKKLEDALDAQLFDRSNRTEPVLTSVGRELFSCSRRIFDDLDATVGSMLGREMSGSLVIAGSSLTGTVLLTQLVVALRRQYESIKPELRLEDSYSALEQGDVDIALRVPNGEYQGFESLPLMQVQMGLYASPSYLVSCPIGADGTGLEKAYTMCSHTDLDWTSLRLQHPGLSINKSRVHHIDNKLSELAAVKAGMGIGYLPRFAVEKDLAEGSLVRVVPSLTGYVDYHLCISLNSGKRAMFDVVAELLISRLKTHYSEYINLFEDDDLFAISA